MPVELQGTDERQPLSIAPAEELDPYDFNGPYLQGRQVGMQRTEAQILIDRRHISAMLRKGWDTFSIWEEINKNYVDNPLSYGTIEGDINWIKKLMIHDTLEDQREANAEMISFWKHLMRTYWEGYERSLGGSTDPTKPGVKFIEEQTSRFLAAEVEAAKIAGRNAKHATKDIKIKKLEVIGGERWLAGIERCLTEIGKLRNAYPKSYGARGDDTPVTDGTDLAQDTPAAQASNILYSLIQLARKRTALPVQEGDIKAKVLLGDGRIVAGDHPDAAEEIEVKDVPTDLDDRMKHAMDAFTLEVDKRKAEMSEDTPAASIAVGDDEDDNMHF